MIIGETMLGRGDRAFGYWKKIAPAFREEISEVHRLEPYVYAQMIAGKDAPKHGEAKNSWLTGTAAWNFVAITQYILGVRPEFDGLRVEPCLPESMTDLTITRRCRGAEYRIKVSRGGSPGMRVDGAAIEGAVIPNATPGDSVEVAITMPIHT